jgi:hypothetical protein
MGVARDGERRITRLKERLIVTIILTELSPAGIAMAADSAISLMRNGRVTTKDQKYWTKLVKVPHLNAAVSYWGAIGLVNARFDEWLRRKINESKSHTELDSFANFIATEMNKAASDKPVEYPIGVHVAGFRWWPDNVYRPVFYHIHNGHGHTTFSQKFVTLNDQKILIETVSKYIWDKRELFRVHDDFSPASKNQPALMEQFQRGFLTANGEYANFSLIYQGLDGIFKTLNSFPGVSVPRRPNELAPRVGFLKTLIEIVIEIYKCSSLSQIIGGRVLTLGIRPDNTFIN